MTYAISFIASKQTPLPFGGIKTNNILSTTIVNALNFEEAVGKGYALAYKVYPVNKGWTNHYAHARPTDAIAEIDLWDEYILE